MIHSPHDRAGNRLVPIRILLASAVILSNCFLLADGVTDADPWKRLNHQQAILGHTAVDFFFILSGFLIADRLLRRGDLRSFFAHRIRRVYPGFLFAIAVSFLVALPLGGGHLEPPAFLSARLPHTLGMGLDLIYRALRLVQPSYTGAFAHNPYPAEVNQPLWSIAYGFLFYGLAALASLVRLPRSGPGLPGGLLRAPRTLTVALIVATAVSVWFQAAQVFPTPRWALATIGYPAMWVRELPMFLGGLTLRSWMTPPVRPLRPVRTTTPWLPLGTLAALAILVSTQIPHGLGAILPFAGPVLLVSVAFTSRVRAEHLTAFGDPSYGAYLLSFPLQQLLVAHWGPGLSAWPLFLVSLPLSLAAGSISWLLVERWFLPRRPQVVEQRLEELEWRAA